jgi:dephospho-CoA kinase
MIIECVGMSGTGKSTAAAALAARLSAERVDVDGRGEIIRLNLHAFIRHPWKYVRRTGRTLTRRESGDIRRYLLRHVFLQRNAVVEKARTYSIAIVDEGHLSNIFSAFEQPLTDHQLLREIRSFDLPDVVVRFTLPEDERKKRLEQRGYFVASDEPEYLLRWERAMLANDAMLAESLERLQVPCIQVDEGVSIETLTAKLDDVVRSAGTRTYAFARRTR